MSTPLSGRVLDDGADGRSAMPWRVSAGRCAPMEHGEAGVPSTAQRDSKGLLDATTMEWATSTLETRVRAVVVTSMAGVLEVMPRKGWSTAAHPGRHSVPRSAAWSEGSFGLSVGLVGCALQTADIFAIAAPCGAPAAGTGTAAGSAWEPGGGACDSPCQCGVQSDGPREGGPDGGQSTAWAEYLGSKRVLRSGHPSSLGHQTCYGCAVVRVA